jgi:hypothetical protein
MVNFLKSHNIEKTDCEIFGLMMEYKILREFHSERR